VQMDDPSTPTVWIRVKLARGRDGFVASIDVRSAGDAVLKLTNERGRWRSCGSANTTSRDPARLGTAKIRKHLGG